MALALNVDNTEAARVLADFGGVRGLVLSPPMALCRPAFHAAVELSRRACLPADTDNTPVVISPASAAQLLVPGLRWAECEELHVLYLGRNCEVIEHARLGVGSERFCIIDPGQILRRGLMIRAAALILAHNHPSGDPDPILQDVAATRRVEELSATLGICLLDHIVVGRGEPGWVSMVEAGVMVANRGMGEMYHNH